MPFAEYPCQMFGRVPVLKAPAEIDVATSGVLRAVLLRWRSRGHALVVVDLGGTVFCDLAGLRELMRAHQRAAADGGGLRLVTPADGAFARIFAITGLDALIPHFATVEQALAQLPAGFLYGRADPVRGPGSLRRRRGGPVGDDRRCEQCGVVFVPAREHARFCSSDCRAAWNQEQLGDRAAGTSAFTWSIAAMSEATARLAAMRAGDKPQALTEIGEAVWWITMIDATLVRHHPRAYDAVLATHGQAERHLIKDTLAGLRFVRNWISREAGLDDIIETGATKAGACGSRVTGWTWKPVPELPALAWLLPRAQAWERTRWQAYQACLAGRTIGNTLSPTVSFLTLTSASARAGKDAG